MNGNKKVKYMVGYYTKARLKKLRWWIKNNKPKIIMGSPVWIVPQSFLDYRGIPGYQIIIQPFAAIFVSDKIPKWLRDTLLYHEFTENKKLQELGHDKAHAFAVEAEYNYLVEHGLLKKFLKWKGEGLVAERVRAWKKKGHKIPALK